MDKLRFISFSNNQLRRITTGRSLRHRVLQSVHTTQIKANRIGGANIGNSKFVNDHPLQISSSRWNSSDAKETGNKDPCERTDCYRLPGDGDGSAGSNEAEAPKSGIIYVSKTLGLLPSNIWTVGGLRYVCLIGTVVSLANVMSSVGYWSGYTGMEFGAVFIPAITFIYFEKQIHLMNRQKPMQISYDADNDKYKLQYFGLFSPKTIEFNKGDLKVPQDPVEKLKSDLEKNDTKEKRDSSLKDTILSFINRPEAELFRISNAGKMEGFEVERKFVDFDNSASEAFYKKHIERAEDCDACEADGLVMPDKDRRALGKLKDE